MTIGKVIRKYRKEKGLTQEEMAIRLGVSTPAVNKWEKDNTLPDISLLVPIARLFGISTDELLSFKDDITDKEIDIFIKELDRRLKHEPYEDVFADAKKKLEEYPGNERLKWQVATVLNAARLFNEVADSDRYDDVICSWFSGLLESEDLSIRKSAAEALFHFYYRKEDYQTAERYLLYYSEDNPERKLMQANIYAKTGKINEAYVAYEEMMLAEVNQLRVIMNALQILCEEDGDLDLAHRVADASSDVAKCFDMGVCQEISMQLELAAYEKNIDETARIMEKLISNCDSISDFTKSNLFSHLSFKQYGKDFYEDLRSDLVKRFCDEETFGYMSGNIYWETLKDKSHKDGELFNEKGIVCNNYIES